MKNEYDSMNERQHNDFNFVWSTEYNDNKYKIEQLNKYIKNNKEPLAFVKNLVAKTMKSHYNNLIVYEEKMYEKHIHNNRHICFILDVSLPMFSFKRNHPL